MAGATTFSPEHIEDTRVSPGPDTSEERERARARYDGKGWKGDAPIGILAVVVPQVIEVDDQPDLFLAEHLEHLFAVVVIWVLVE